MMKKIVSIIIILSLIVVSLAACDASDNDRYNTQKAANVLAEHQPTPTDIDYSLERYNLVRRAYWVNGQREKALEVQCPIKKPIGYIALFGTNGNLIATYEVDGKVTSLNSYLSPDSDYYTSSSYAHWLADVDGSYGTNVDGVFWFTTDNHYMEWTGTYLYSDVPFNFSNT